MHVNRVDRCGRPADDLVRRPLTARVKGVSWRLVADRPRVPSLRHVADPVTRGPFDARALDDLTAWRGSSRQGAQPVTAPLPARRVPVASVWRILALSRPPPVRPRGTAGAGRRCDAAAALPSRCRQPARVMTRWRRPPCRALLAGVMSVLLWVHRDLPDMPGPCLVVLGGRVVRCVLVRGVWVLFAGGAGWWSPVRLCCGRCVAAAASSTGSGDGAVAPPAMPGALLGVITACCGSTVIRRRDPAARRLAVSGGGAGRGRCGAWGRRRSICGGRVRRRRRRRGRPRPRAG